MDEAPGLLTVPATIGEIWIIGYVSIVGVHDHAGAQAVVWVLRAP